MKKILVLEGSPRAKGNTALVTDWVLAGLGERGVRIERVRAADKKIAGCRECFSCMSSKSKPGCSQDDDMTGICRSIMDCDLVVITSPIFCWNITSQAKAVLDRCFALLVGKNLVRKKSLALVLTAGGDQFDGADLAVRMFRDFARYSGMNYLGQLVIAPCPDRPGLGRNRTLRDRARAFGQQLRRSVAGNGK